MKSIQFRSGRKVTVNDKAADILTRKNLATMAEAEPKKVKEPKKQAKPKKAK